MNNIEIQSRLKVSNIKSMINGTIDRVRDTLWESLNDYDNTPSSFTNRNWITKLLDVISN